MLKRWGRNESLSSFSFRCVLSKGSRAFAPVSYTHLDVYKRQTLKKLKAAGWIVEIAEDESRILYAATDEGRAVLERDFVRRKRLVAFAEAQLGEAGEENHG